MELRNHLQELTKETINKKVEALIEDIKNHAIANGVYSTRMVLENEEDEDSMDEVMKELERRGLDIRKINGSRFESENRKGIINLLRKKKDVTFNYKTEYIISWDLKEKEEDFEFEEITYI